MKFSERQVNIIEKVIISVIEAYGSIPNEKKLTAEAKRFLTDFSAHESIRIFNFLLAMNHESVKSSDAIIEELIAGIKEEIKDEKQYSNLLVRKFLELRKEKAGSQITLTKLEHIYNYFFPEFLQTLGEFGQVNAGNYWEWAPYFLAKKLNIKGKPTSTNEIMFQVTKTKQGKKLYGKILSNYISMVSAGLEYFKTPKEKQLEMLLSIDVDKAGDKTLTDQLSTSDKKLLEEFLDRIYLWYDLNQNDLVDRQNLKPATTRKHKIPTGSDLKLLKKLQNITDKQQKLFDNEQSINKFKHNQILTWLLLSILHYKALNHQIESKQSIHFDKFKETIQGELNRCAKIATAAQRCHYVLHSRIIGNSKPMIELKTKLWRACFGESLLSAFNYEKVIRKQNVLFLGESGVGKELCAEAIQEGVFWHEKGEIPKIKINISALSKDLVESELFGHVKGAFTGATTNREGTISKADNAAIFFDEIGDLHLHLQTKLLRAIDQGEIQKVGEDKISKNVNVRFICATNKNIYDDKQIRRDLFERISGVVIRIPPLRERREDIVLIRDNYIKKNIEGFHLFDYERSKFMQQMSNYESDWPGNVRQLESAIKSSLLGLDIAENIDRTVKSEYDNIKFDFDGFDNIRDCEFTFEELKYWYLKRVLNKVNNNNTHAARELGISLTTLHRWLKDRNINI